MPNDDKNDKLCLTCALDRMAGKPPKPCAACALLNVDHLAYGSGAPDPAAPERALTGVVFGKFRRPGRPSAPLRFFPGLGVGVQGETVPADPAAAAAWCRANGGWVRFHASARTCGEPAVRAFVRAWHRRPS